MCRGSKCTSHTHPNIHFKFDGQYKLHIEIEDKNWRRIKGELYRRHWFLFPWCFFSEAALVARKIIVLPSLLKKKFLKKFQVYLTIVFKNNFLFFKTKSRKTHLVTKKLFSIFLFSKKENMIFSNNIF